MAYSTIAQIRASNKKLEDSTEVPDAVITDRIAEADNTIKVDLSKIATEAE